MPGECGIFINEDPEPDNGINWDHQSIITLLELRCHSLLLNEFTFG